MHSTILLLLENSEKVVFLYPMNKIDISTFFLKLYEDAPPQRGTFFRLQVYKRVRILLVEIYERGGESVISICKRTKKS